MSRYGLGKVVHRFAIGEFPFGTLLVNIVGCLIIGAISAIFETKGESSSYVRLFLIIGLMGGFTTFSAFGQETFMLWKNGSYSMGMMNVAANVILGLASVGGGRLLVLSIR